jgi:hypothetical protein
MGSHAHRRARATRPETTPGAARARMAVSPCSALACRRRSRMHSADLPRSLIRAATGPAAASFDPAARAMFSIWRRGRASRARHFHAPNRPNAPARLCPSSRTGAPCAWRARQPAREAQHARPVPPPVLDRPPALLGRFRTAGPVEPSSPRPETRASGRATRAGRGSMWAHGRHWHSGSTVALGRQLCASPSPRGPTSSPLPARGHRPCGSLWH